MKSCVRLAATMLVIAFSCAAIGNEIQFSAKADVDDHEVVASKAGKAGAFTLSRTSVAINAVQYLATPAPESVAVRITGKGVKQVGVSNLAPWMNATIVPAGKKQFTVNIGVNGTVASPGTYNASIVIATATKKGKILKTANVAVTFTILSPISIGALSGSAQFTYGHSLKTRMLSLDVIAPQRTWTAVSDSPWLTVAPGARSGSGSVSMAVDVSGLAPGTYSGGLWLANSAAPTDVRVYTLTLVVALPALSFDRPKVEIADVGTSSPDPVELGFDLDTGTAAYPYTLEFTADDGGDWLALGAGNGTVDGDGTTVELTADPSSVEPGSRTGKLKLTATVGSWSFVREIPVSYDLEEHRVVVGAEGVGLSSTPARSVLQRTIAIESSRGRDGVAWQASADQPWLQVTASGVTGGELLLTADPVGLASGTTHFATVTVGSDAGQFENTQTIRVGLYVEATPVADVSVPAAMKHLVASPVEPLVFVNDGANTIKAIHVYTGAVERTFTGVPGGAGAMTISGDGQRLFVYDRINLQVRELDAVSGTILRSFDSPVLFSSAPKGGGIAYMRPDGYRMLITPSSLVYDLDTGAAYQSLAFSFPVYASAIGVAPSGERVAMETGSVYTVSRSALGGGTFKGQLEFYTGTAAVDGGQSCFRGDSAVIYTASGAPHEFPGVSVTTHLRVQTLPGDLYPNSIVCSWNGLVVGGLGDASSTIGDVWVYDGNQGILLAQRNSSSTNPRSLVKRGLAISADGVRVISLGGNPDPYTSNTVSGTVWLQTVPAPAP